MGANEGKSLGTGVDRGVGASDGEGVGDRDGPPPPQDPTFFVSADPNSPPVNTSLPS